MTTAGETVFDRIVDVVIAPAENGAKKHATVHVVLGAPGGKQVRCPLTVKAALNLRAMLSSRLNVLVADSDGRDDA